MLGGEFVAGAVLAHPLLALALVFLMDGLGVPLMPELGALFAFFLHPSMAWGALLVLLAVAVETAAAGALYLAVSRLGAPRPLARLMQAYQGGMLVRDERLLLLNRVVPVLPVAGAFIAVAGWRPTRSLAYVALGSALKYALLLAASGAAFSYFRGPWPAIVSLGCAGLFLTASWGYTWAQWRRRRAAAS